MRRHFASLVLIVSLMFSCGGSGEKEPARETAKSNTTKSVLSEWTSFRGDPGLSARSDSPLPDKLEILWTFKTGGEIKSGAVVGASQVIFTSYDGTVYALNADTGERSWSFESEFPVEASPLIAEGRVYVGSFEGTLYALDLASGKKIWSYQTDGRIAGSANLFRAAKRENDTILVGSYDNRLHAVSALTGAPKWLAETGYFINGTAAIEESTAVFGGCDAFLHIISLDTGEKNGRSRYRRLHSGISGFG